MISFEEYNPLTPLKSRVLNWPCVYFCLQIASGDSDGTECFQVKIDPRDTKNQDLFIYIFGGGLGTSSE